MIDADKIKGSAIEFAQRLRKGLDDNWASFNINRDKAAEIHAKFLEVFPREVFNMSGLTDSPRDLHHYRFDGKYVYVLNGGATVANLEVGELTWDVHGVRFLYGNRKVSEDLTFCCGGSSAGDKLLTEVFSKVINEAVLKCFDKETAAVNGREL